MHFALCRWEAHFWASVSVIQITKASEANFALFCQFFLKNQKLINAAMEGPRDTSECIFCCHLWRKQKLIIQLLIFLTCATTFVDGRAVLLLLPLCCSWHGSSRWAVWHRRHFIVFHFSLLKFWTDEWSTEFRSVNYYGVIVLSVIISVLCSMHKKLSVSFNKARIRALGMALSSTSQYSTVVLTVVRVMIAKYRKSGIWGYRSSLTPEPIELK